MSKKMKKFLSMVLVVSLTAGIAIGGTMAYLTSEDSDVNVMTLGNVEIKQHEQERNEEGKLVDFTQEKPAYPVVGPVRWADERIDVNGTGYKVFTEELKNVVDKIVTVENTGKSDAFIRTLVAIEAPDYDPNDLIHINYNNDVKISSTVNVEIDGIKYVVFEFTYSNAIAPEEISAPSLMQVFLDSKTTNEDCANFGDTWEILVLSQAVQTEGFSDAQIALDEAFGDVNAEKAADWFSNIDKILVSTSEELLSALQSETDEDEMVTVIMQNDIVLTSQAKITGNVILDMNGHTLSDTTGKVEVMLRARPGGKLTITGNGRVYSENHNKWMLYTDEGGQIIVENGEFVKAPYNWGNDCEYVGCEGGVSHTSNAQKLNPLLCGKGVITVYDGYFDCGIMNPEYTEQYSRPVVHDCMYPTINISIDQGSGHVVIYGGTFVTANPVDGDDNPKGSTNDGNQEATEKAFFLYGQEEYGVLPDGYTVVTGHTSDGRVTYTYSYNK